MCVRTHEAGGPGPASEATLFRQAQAGCLVSLNTLMAHHDGLVQAVVRQQVLGDLPFAEALQAGRIGLWQAIVGFDPARGLAFSTYAWPCIMHQVWRAVKAYPPLDSPTVMGDGLLSLAAPDPAAVWEAAAARRALHDLVHHLPQRLRQVIVARYGLDGAPPTIYRQIGAALGLSGERVRQLHTEALVWLRHPAHSQHLRSLLGYHTLADYTAADALAQRWLRQRGGRHGY
jgi:RNA polymerase sigma factor (sigma-70 family)